MIFCIQEEGDAPAITGDIWLFSWLIVRLKRRKGRVERF